MNRSPTDRFRVFLYAAVAVSVATAIWGLGLHLVPDSVGEALLGSTWNLSRSILSAVTVQYVVGAFALTSGTMLISLNSTGAAVLQSLGLGVGRITNAVILSWAIGNALALSVGESVVLAAVAVATWSYGYRRVQRQRNSHGTADDAQIVA